MEEKRCFKCGEVKPLSEFYKHPQMADGHLNKCMECTKQDVKRDYERKSQDEAWLEKERARGREKFRRLGYTASSFKKIRSICPSNGDISKRLRALGLWVKGKEAHHWNYNFPRSVILLSRKAHHRIHTMLRVNHEDKYCYTLDGQRIETEEQAKSIFSRILNEFGINEPIEILNI